MHQANTKGLVRNLMIFGALTVVVIAIRLLMDYAKAIAMIG